MAGTTRALWKLLALAAIVFAACGPAAQAPAGTPTAPKPTESTPGETRQVIFAAAMRSLGRLHLFDAATLEPLGYVVTSKVVDDVSVAPDGQTVFIAQATTPEGQGCCALFALDLATGAMCRLNEPALHSVPSPDGRWVFTQRGNVGLEVFDARTLARMPTIEAPGVYGLHPSPDSRWLFGLTNWDGPSIDIFDLGLMRLVRRLPVPADRDKDWSGDNGVWLGEYFYYYLHQSEHQAYLWTITPERSSLDAPVALTVALPGVTGAQLPAHANLVGGGGRLFVYTPLSWWSKVDPRSTGEAVTGGVFVVEPTKGKVAAHLVPSQDFGRVIASPDGRYLYGLVEEGPRREGPVRLLKLDAVTGTVLAEHMLPSDAWSITTATLPETLVPRGEVQPAACGRPGL